MRKKVLVIGIDGMDFKSLNTLMDSGIMPLTAELAKKSCTAEGIVDVNPVTAPLWVSFATGKNSGKHGIYDFIMPEDSLANPKTFRPTKIKSKTFYQTLSEAGHKCIIVNMPGAYPPLAEGIFTSDFTSPSKDLVHPKELLEELPVLKKYKVIPKAALTKPADYLKGIIEVEDARFECAKELFEKKEWDFFFFMFSGTDWAQHAVYEKLMKIKNKKKLSKEEALGTELFRKVDSYINWFVEHNKEGNTLILSDHGFKTYKGMFYTNTWLKEEGYLKQKTESMEKTVAPNEIEAEAMKQLSGKFRIKIPNFLFNFLTSHKKLFKPLFLFYIKFEENLLTWLPIKFQQKHSPDISSSRACSLIYREIYINDKERYPDGIVEKEEYEKLREEIISKLKALKHPTENKPMFKDVIKKEEAYHGNQIKDCGDIIIVPDEYDSTARMPPVVHDTTPTNNHSQHSIFMATGPDIKKGKTSPIRIYDFAPTILHMFGLPVPSEMDGKVLKGIFKEESEYAKKEVKYETEKERLDETIKNLKLKGKI